MSPPLASGRTAEIIPWGEGEVVKLFREGISRDAAERERRATAAAFTLGLPVPRAGEVHLFGDRFGLILERLEGPSMMQEVLGDTRVAASSARRLAELHLELHQHAGPPDLPEMHDHLADKIASCPLLDDATRAAARAALQGLPGGDALCHGDFHPGNVILTSRGPMIIDWIDAARGNPVADIARTALLFLGHIEALSPSDPAAAPMQLYLDIYLERSLARHPAQMAEFGHWLPVLAAARLREGIGEQEAWLLRKVREGLRPSG